jgi:hypothetical protein
MSEELTCVIGDSGSTNLICPPNFELVSCGAAGQRYDALCNDYVEWDRIGGNVLWRQLRADAAFFVQRTRRKRTYGYTYRFLGATDAWDAYGNVWWYHPIYISVPHWQTVDEVHDAGGWIVANNAVYRMAQEQADAYEAVLDAIAPGGGPNGPSVYYTPGGWMHVDNLFVQFTQSADPDMEWVRVSYDGQKIVRNGVYNPIELSTDEIATHHFLVDCAEKSIWVGAA